MSVMNDLAGFLFWCALTPVIFTVSLICALHGWWRDQKLKQQHPPKRGPYR